MNETSETNSARLIMGSGEQQTSRGQHEKTVTLRANRIRKTLDYTKLENPLYVSQRHEPRLNASEEHKGDKDESLVKHMRNLPDYLQREEKDDKNLQGKALNFGVLDWGRLENWKSNEKRIPPRYNMKSSSSPLNNHHRKRIHPPRRDQRGSKSSPINSSSSDRLPPGVRWPRGQGLKLEIPKSSGQMLDRAQTESVEIDIKKGKQSELKTSSHADDLSLSDYRNSRDVYMIEANENRVSELFSPVEFDSPTTFSDVPHSCPFPLTLDSPETDLPLTPSIDEQIVKERHSSPMRRFSFSLGKMTRSFSFKESSSIPQLSPSSMSSVKSGPVNLESDDHRWKKGNVTTPSRASPLRRLLDPLLKLKGGSDQKAQKSKLDLNSPGVNVNELLQSKKNISSSNVQALLQLTMKNGIPFFKLVIESSSDILAAAVKKLPSGKDDSSLIYAFYSVHENKKSGSWMYQGSKEKIYRFGYTVVGQMKISSSYHAEFSGPEKDLYVVRESVLYSTDTVQTDQKLLDCMVDRELAGIIVKNLSDESGGGDIGRSKSTVVVLPNGVHSLPNTGLPSPLINRWRSGGACDCGGWDIGCQFRVLGHQNEIATPTPSTSDRLDLSYQGGRKKKLGFSLVSLEDGLYSVEYDPSMSLLQAFSVCVAVVSSQKLTHIFQVNSVAESKELSRMIEKVEVTGKYASKPPASPVGRV